MVTYFDRDLYFHDVFTFAGDDFGHNGCEDKRTSGRYKAD